MKISLAPTRWRTATALILAALFASQLTAARVGGLPDTSRMNVLYLLIEDCNADVWGAYGNKICQTPQMDRFSSTAPAFARCAPRRSRS